VCVELHRLRGVFLAAIGADDTKIEASFFEALRIAREQKSTVRFWPKQRRACGKKSSKSKRASRP
jgi:hypothetical protein